MVVYADDDDDVPCWSLMQVTTYALRKLLGERLSECYTVYGHPTFTAALNAVDPAILKQLQETSQALAPAPAGGP